MLFKNKRVLAMAAMAMGLLGIETLPVVDGKVAFNDDQENKLKASITGESLEALIKAFNEEIAANVEVQGLQSEIQTMLQEAGLTVEQVAILHEQAKAGGEGMSAHGSAIKALLDKKDKTIQALIKDPEPDTPLAEIKGAIQSKIKSSATHLFASNKEFDAFAGRPWNARAAGHKVTAADYTDSVTIDKLNGDATLYFRENPDELKSLHRDNFGLPAFWPKRLNVDATVATGSILTAEITQGRKFGWLPKNNQVIEPEEGKIYPVQIDAEWDGFRLQAIEDSWLNFMNKEGSSPEKMSFVRFLVAELMKQARVEDRISTINGIYVQTPETAGKAGKMINRQNGLFYQLWRARDVFKKYRAFNIGKPTTTNIYDYLHEDSESKKGLLTLLPFDVRYAPNLKLYMAKKFWDAYKGKYKELNGQNMDYKGLPEYPENYPNIEVVNLVDHNSDFIFLTFGDNIEILENIPAEKSAYKFQWLLRKLHLMADYKLGVRLIHIGRPAVAGEPEQFKVQSVWSNSEPVFSNDVFAPAFDDKTGVLKVDFHNLQVDETWDTNITSLSGVQKGQVIRIQGNTGMTNAKNLVDAGDLNLASDFNLKLGGTITLYIGDDMKANEISRTTAPEAAPLADVEFTTAAIDANDGHIFRCVAPATLALTGILNGYEGQKVTIYGTDAASADVTIANSTTVSVGSSVTLGTSAHYIEFVKIDGVFKKVKLVNS